MATQKPDFQVVLRNFLELKAILKHLYKMGQREQIVVQHAKSHHIEVSDLDIDTGCTNDKGPLFRIPHPLQPFEQLWQRCVLVRGQASEDETDSKAAEEKTVIRLDYPEDSQLLRWIKEEPFTDFGEILRGAYYDTEIGYHTSFKVRP